MSKIWILDPVTASQIAAGEVVERPASVVKEMCENSLDAAASQISIHIEKGGIESIQIEDNGQGMDKEDALLAFEAHATSKLRKIEDLNQLKTKGFRGEALASIASVSRIHLETCLQGEKEGTKLFLEAGHLEDFQTIAARQGTKILVRDLFFNTPARYKFLKKDSTEADKIKDVVLRLALAHPQVSFRLYAKNKLLLKSPGTGKLEDAIYALLGKEYLDACIPLPEVEENAIRLKALIGQCSAARSSKSGQYFFVNGRSVKSPTLNKVLERVYEHRLMKGKYPLALLYLDLPGHLVDVNVHPQKLEVRFAEEGEVFRFLYHALDTALMKDYIPPHQAPKMRKVPSDLFNYTTQTKKEEENLSKREHNHKFTQAQTAFWKDLVAIPTELKEEAKQEHKENTLCLVRDEEENSFNNAHLFEQKKAQSISDSRLIEKKEGIEELASSAPSATKNALEDSPSFNMNAKPSSPTRYEEHNVSDHLDTFSSGKEVSRTLSQEKHQGNMSNLQVAEECPKAYSLHPMQDEERPLHTLPYVGTAFNTYVILEDKETLWYIDQHAAHEKILFEKFYHTYKEQGSFPKQNFLVPQEIFLTPEEFQTLEKCKNDLDILGFEVELFSEHSILLRSQPLLVDSYQSQTMLQDALSYFMKQYKLEKEAALDTFMRDYLAEVACKAAIKANYAMSEHERIDLLKAIEKLEEAFHCPHGRPLLIQMSKTELERRFKRLL